MRYHTLLHLRFPFSFFLLPVYLFALSQSTAFKPTLAILTGILVHLLLYPASNGYNSYFDKDEQSIGGLKNPPAVSLQLYYTALVMDLVAVVAGLVFINVEFAIMLLVYGLASKAYSHPSVRLKKYPMLGWLTIFFFQGYFTYLFCYVGINDVTISETFVSSIQIPALLSSLLLGGSYPMTQIYQHEEDGQRGDQTISRKLGILGTFHFTAVAFVFAMLGFVYFYLTFGHWIQVVLLQVILLPVLVYFVRWYFKVRGNVALADYSHTMTLNLISSSALNLFFTIEFLRTLF